jgi:rhodanese-related sulfurtransferase
MAQARELSEAIEVACFDGSLDSVAIRAAFRRAQAGKAALRAAGWRLGGPTRNVPGGALSWVVERAAS